MTEILLRRAHAADAAALGALARAAYADAVPLIGRPPAPVTADYAAVIAASRVWLAERNGAAVGMLVTRVDGEQLLLENVAVLPAEQGAGLGSRLLALAESDARAAGVDRVRLATNEAMVANLRFYPSRGYRETDRRVEDGFRRVFFEKRLAPQRRGW